MQVPVSTPPHNQSNLLERERRREPPPPPPRPRLPLRAPLTLFLLLLAVLANFATADTWHWVSRPLNVSQGSFPDPQLVVKDARGTEIARSRDCRILSQADEQWIAGRVRLPRTADGPFSLALEASRTKSRLPAIRLEDGLLAAPASYDVVLLLDASHSMRNNDPRDLRKQATTAFWRLASSSSRIRRLSLVRFRKDTRLLIPPTSPADIASLDSALDKLRPYSSTDFGPPFVEAARLLDEAPGGRAVLFLSDGEPREDYADTHRKLADIDAPVYTIGLSEEADGELLSRIAAETGGQYFQAPAADQLDRIFHRIFRILSEPRTVVEYSNFSGKGEFVVDPEMTNPFLTLAARGQGKSPVKLDSKPLPSAATGGVYERDLSDLPAGAHRISVPADLHASWTVRAETDVSLTPFAVNRSAPRGADLVFGCFVRGAENLDKAQLKGKLLTPEGQWRELPLETTPFGLRSARFPAPSAGRYKVVLTLHAERKNSPVLRQRQLDFVRTAAGAPAVGQTADAQPVKLSRDTAESASAPLTVSPKTDPQATKTGLQTTFWSEPSSLKLTPYPGEEQAKTVTIRLNSAASADHPITVVAESANRSVSLRVRGTPQPNQTTELTVTARADERSAGKPIRGHLTISRGSRSWSVPIRGQVQTPRLVATFDAGEWQVEARELVRRGTVTVSVAPEGRCEVRTDPEEGSPWQAPQNPTVADTDPVDIPLAFRVPLPEERTRWEGAVTVVGPGLETISLPWEFAWQPEVAAADSGLSGPTAPGSGRFPWAWLVWTIAALLVFLLILTIRGSQRAAFLLVSAIIHLIVLFFTLPDSTLEEIADSATMKPQTVAVGKAVQEEEIAAETERRQSEDAAPTEGKSEKTESETEQNPNEKSNNLDAPAKSAKTQENEAPDKLHKDTEKTRRESEDLQAETGEPVKKHRAKTQTPETTAAEAESAPETTVVDISEASQQNAQPRAVPTTKTSTVDTPVNTLHKNVTKSAAKTEDVRSETSPSAPRKHAAQIHLGSPADAAESSRPVNASSGDPDDVSRQAPTSAAKQPRTQVAAGAKPRNVAGKLAKRMLEVADAAPSSADAPIPRKSETRAGQQSAPRKTTHTNSAIGRLSSDQGEPAADQPARNISTGSRRAPVDAPTPSLVGRPNIAKTAPRKTTAPLTSPSRSQSPPPTKRRKESSGFAAAPQNTNTVGTAVSSANAEGGDTDRGVKLAAIRNRSGRPRVSSAPTSAPPTTPAPRRARRIRSDPTDDHPPLNNPPTKKRRSATHNDEGAPAEDSRKQTASLQPTTPTSPPLPSRPIPVKPPQQPPQISGDKLTEPPTIGRKSTAANSAQSRWRRTFPNFKHSGDWDCDRTAMLNLAHQVEHRTGSILPFESRNVSVEDENLHKAPFLFMSGHNDFVFTDQEVEFLRSYLKKGGALWINDSTDVDNETFDRAARRELKRVLPDQRLREIPLDHPIFQAPYDLSKGFAGFRVPPGDKYRQDYLEGVWQDKRLTVVYTRNDYGDGLEIDAHTRALMPSLTDLTQGEMQEASVQMGTNISLYFVQGREDNEDAQLSQRAARSVKNPAEERRRRWENVDAKSLPLCNSAGAWSKPDGWDGPHYLPVAAEDTGRENFVGVRFRHTDGEFEGWRAQATLARSVSMTLTNEQVLLFDVINPMKGGARIAVAFTSPNNPYIESAPIFLRPGLNRNIAIDLRENSFKTEAVNWESRASFPDDITLDRIFILTYPQQPTGAIEFGNPRLANP